MTIIFEDGKPMVRIQIVFQFRKEIKKEAHNYADTDEYMILNEIQNLGFSPVANKRAILKNCIIFCYDLRVKQLPYDGFKTFSEINNKYSEVLKEIIISEDKNIDLDWENKQIKKISLNHLDKLFNTFIKTLDSIQLEMVLKEAILGSRDSLLTQEQFETYGLVDNFKILQELFKDRNHSINPLKPKEIKKIFRSIDLNDFILMKQIFHLILMRCTYTSSQLFEEYEKIKGKRPFPRNQLKLIVTSENASNYSKLEMFLREYIHNKNITEIVREKENLNLSDIKIQIPFDIRGYNIDSYPKTVSSIIESFFNTRRNLILDTFKEILFHELKRLKVKFDGLLISYEYSSSKSNIEKLRVQNYYFDVLKDLYDKKLDKLRRATENGKINEFVILKGFYITNRNQIHLDWSKTFKIRDIKHKRLNCKIIHNRTYFNNLELSMETQIEIQGNLKIVYEYIKKTKERKIKEQYLEVIDIKVIDNFKAISYHLGKFFQGDKYIENTPEGLSLFTYPVKQKENETKVYFQTKILYYPLNLLNIYEDPDITHNKRLFYEVKLGREVVCLTKELLIDYMDENNLIIDEGLAKKAISQIIREIKRENKMIVKPKYNTVGIFRNKENKLVLVYEDDENQRLIGTNDVQIELIEHIKEMELDREGKLTKYYYDIFHNPTLPLHPRVSVLGYSAIAPFFYAMSQKLDLFPYVFLIGKHGSGKTTTLELFLNILFGTVLKKVEDIESKARLTKFMTENLMVIDIDDIDSLPENFFGFLKSISTRKGKRNRMDGQKMNSEQMYANIAGSANEDEFLLGSKNEAFRQRCIIHKLPTNISNKNKDAKRLIREFVDNRAKIISSNLIYGYYLLNKSLEYIDNTSKAEITNYQKLENLYDKTKEKITNYLDSNNVDYCDIRRTTLYTLIYLGLRFWKYTFESNDLPSELLDSILDLDGNNFAEYARELEKAEKDLLLQIFDNIIEFWRLNQEKFGNRRNKDEIVVLKTDFINAYDKWAKIHGYEILEKLTKLGQYQSELLNRDISTGPKRYTDNHNRKYHEYGLLFYIEEIIMIRNGSRAKLEGSIDSLDLALDLFVEDNASKEFQKFRYEIKRIFEEKNYPLLEKKAVITVLDLEDELNREMIEGFIESLIKEGIITEYDKEISLRKTW